MCHENVSGSQLGITVDVKKQHPCTSSLQHRYKSNSQNSQINYFAKLLAPSYMEKNCLQHSFFTS